MYVGYVLICFNPRRLDAETLAKLGTYRLARGFAAHPLSSPHLILVTVTPRDAIDQSPRRATRAERSMRPAAPGDWSG